MIKALHASILLILFMCYSSYADVLPQKYSLRSGVNPNRKVVRMPNGRILCYIEKGLSGRIIFRSPSGRILRHTKQDIQLLKERKQL